MLSKPWWHISLPISKVAVRVLVEIQLLNSIFPHYQSVVLSSKLKFCGTVKIV
jgi:hypothetical protein